MMAAPGNEALAASRIAALTRQARLDPGWVSAVAPYVCRASTVNGAEWDA